MNNKLISGLCRQLDASPTSRHVIEYLAKQLLNNGFTDCTNHKEIQSKNSNGFITRAGSLVVWRTGSQDIRNGFHIVGAHTDSPGLKLKPQPDESRFGWQTLQVEIYGSPLLNSWLDRDLGIAGHAVLRNGSVRLFCESTPLARISQLAIHLDREVNERGLTLNKQLHLSSAWATDKGTETFQVWLAKQIKTKQSDIVAVDAQLFG